MKSKEERRDRLLRVRRKYRAGIGKIDTLLKELGDRAKDPLTASEFKKRDPIIQRIFFIPLMHRMGITANHISYVGFILVTAYNILTALGFYPVAFATGFLGVLTDIVDGPRARYKDPVSGKDSVTGFGTFLDHTRDYYFAISFGWDAFFRFGHASFAETIMAVAVSVSYLLILLTLIIRYQLWTVPLQISFKEIFSRSYVHDAYERFSRFCLMELQTDFWGRAQFITLVIGVLLLFLGKFLVADSLISFSYVFFGGTITLAVVNVLKAEDDDETDTGKGGV